MLISLLVGNYSQCADEQSNKSVEDKDRTFTPGVKAWSGDPKSALFEILHNKEHFF